MFALVDGAIRRLQKKERALTCLTNFRRKEW